MPDIDRTAGQLPVAGRACAHLKGGIGPMFAVTVTLEVDPADLPAFLPLMLTNARSSLADEPGCHRFDVCTDAARPGEVFLYELYTDAAAFAAHQETPHFKTFDAAAGPMILSKRIRTYAEVRP